MAESTVPKSRRDGSVLLEDGTATTPLSYAVAVEDGTFQFTPGKPARTVVRDRNAIAGLIPGDDPVGTGSFSVHMREFTNAAADGTLIDFIEQTGKYASFTSTASAAFRQKLGKLTHTVEGTDHGDGADHVLVCNDVFFDWDYSEGDINIINVTFEVYGTVTRTGPT